MDRTLNIILILTLYAALTVSATTRFVSLSNSAPAAPFTNWATAATNIQDAIEAALASDEILVTNGVYQSGGRAVYGSSNRVAVTKPLTLRSVNGPAVTSIIGSGSIGPTAVRCVYLTNGALLAGFTLTNGATQTAGNEKNQFGGGIWCESSNAVVTNCELAGNSAYGSGGGAYGGTLNRCALTGNSAGNGAGAYRSSLSNCALTDNSASGFGGGAYQCTLNNCTLTGNSAMRLARQGGGASYCTLNNCIVFYNTATSAENFDDACTLNNCCTTPLPDSGIGNIDAEPQLASAWHLTAASPCRSGGSATYATGVDIDGEPWGSPPSIGCDEYSSGSVTGRLSVAIIASFTNVATGFAVDFRAMIDGRATVSSWDFGDGVVVSNRPWFFHAWEAPGDYVVELRAYNESYPTGIAASISMRLQIPPVHYVDLDSVNALPPYSSWATAATTIQDAVDAATLPGALVLVKAGEYHAGVHSGTFGGNYRVAVTKPLTVRSVNGPAVTRIMGLPLINESAVGCVYLTNGALLSGFTLKNGASEDYGGGVYCESLTAVVSNCVLTGNLAHSGGGGAYCGTLNNCTLTGNLATWQNGLGGGAIYSVLNNCTLTGNSAPDQYGWGGGAHGGMLNNCTLITNSASYGGGASLSRLSNCTLAGNSVTRWGAFGGTFGGGTFFGSLNNCTLIANSASSGGGSYCGILNNCTLAGNSASVSGGGVFSSTNKNCILYYNTAPDGGNYFGGVFNYCCTTALPAGPGSFTNAPLFADTNGWTNLRLQPNSPCINAGNNAYAPGIIDLDGNPRIQGGTVDLGAYEIQSPQSIISYAWLQQFGLPTDGSADYVDTDFDGMNNWQEWTAGTDPTNAASALRILAATWTPSTVTVTWSSATNRSYSVDRATNLSAGPSFSLLQSNIAGRASTTSWTDIKATSFPLLFYRVRVEQ